MTGNTKYFARIKAQLEGPTASTTARYHGPQKILNPKKISVTQLRVASQPQEDQPNLQTPQPLLSQGSREGGTGWLSSEQPCSPTHDGDSLQPVPQQQTRRWERGRGVAGQADSAGAAHSSQLCALGTREHRAVLRGAAPSGSPWPWPCCITALCMASRL